MSAQAPGQTRTQPLCPLFATLPHAGASSAGVNSSFCIDVPELLIVRLRRRELAAFEQVYRLFEKPAWNLARRMLGNAQDAREVVHDAMLRVFDRADQYRGDSPFWGWLRRIVINESLMHLRHQRGQLEETFDEGGHEALAETASPWVWAESRQIESALARLPALTRSVLWLYHVEGHTHPEIAGLTGKSVSFSKSQLARGTARLRELLDVHSAPQPAPLPLLATS